ncbi:MAG: glycoside hydrolase family 3 N-terminal domain-containing protein [Bacteroidales bacterium]|jgi:beta-glucosidase-like glycosyl hydrolase/CubicO group peptidase (beta-lactamase class C family)
MMKKLQKKSIRILLLLFLIGCSFKVLAQEGAPPVYLSNDNQWVDSVYNSLTPRERIAQLIMVAAFSNKGPEHQAQIEKLIVEKGIGGLAFFQGGPVRQSLLVNRYQSIAKVPLLMAIDAEWGLAMRLDSTTKFPYQMALGAIQDHELIYRMGSEIGRELKETGIQMNFAPDVDVNSNPNNPVINYRSFGEDPVQVSMKGLAYMNGLQDMLILATAKHFPGHGDADTDSHLALPRINRTIGELDSVELFPFRQLIAAGLGSVMVAHLEVPAVETKQGVPTTLSHAVVTELLREKMGFRGLVVTDALNMKGVTLTNPPGEIEVKAIEAGNDLLIYVADVELAIQGIEKAVESGRLSELDIERRCKNILAVKKWTGLNSWKPLLVDSLDGRLNNPVAEVINRELVAASLTVLQNRDSIIPLKNLDQLKIASVILGRTEETPFQHRLSGYAQIDRFQLGEDAPPEQVNALRKKLESYTLVIIGVQNMDQRAARDFGLSAAEITFIHQVSEKVPVIAAIFGNPYAISKLKDPGQFAGLIIAYQETDLSMDLTAQLIFGGIGATGRLPVSAEPWFKAGDGIDTDGGIRFSYTNPESCGVDSRYIKKKIDSICEAGITAHAYPGCEVFAARNGKVFFQQCYGNHSYEPDQPVSPDDLFDMASVTKVSAPTVAIMRLVQDKKIDLNVPFSKYWTDFKGTDKANMTVRQVLAHVGGLASWIPFWRDTRNPDGSYKEKTLQADSNSRFPVRVSEGLWRYKSYDKVIYKKIKDEPASKERKYVYSDLSFHLWPKIIEKLTGKKYEAYLKDQFYKPLGANTLTYNPLRFFNRDRIIPTERDTFFRMEVLHGYVHDEGAAMLGGVSGNAGLFGTAQDLAKLWQMYLWKGSYGGRQFISPAILDEFTRYQYASLGIRRGLGFDKPLIGNDTLNFDNCYPCPSASTSSFGHSGYTGTFVWADPTNGLLYVFLCNRVYPTRDNSKLTDLYIRKSVLEAFYQGMKR